MAWLCPQGVNVFFYTTELAEEVVCRRRKRILWRLRDSDEGVALDVTPTPEKRPKVPGLIVVPPQKPHRGRVGDFIKTQTIWEKCHSQSFAAEFYRAAAVEQHYFQGRHEPFGCSVADCDAWLDQPEQYTTYLLATRHGKGETPPREAGALIFTNYKLELMSEQDTRKSHPRIAQRILELVGMGRLSQRAVDHSRDGGNASVGAQCALCTG